MTDRPTSILTVQSEAPPPYSEYDDTHASVPEPNAETQAMLRGGYLINSNQHTPQHSIQDESPAAVYIRSRSYNGSTDDLITIARAIHPTIKVDGIPFPNEYPAVSSRDVTPEDWKFFATSIVDELEVPAPKGSVPTPMSLPEFRERQDTIDVVVEQWNHGFFAPRGIHVVPAYSFGRRVPSPTPSYRTEQTGVSEAAEIETVTFDTSPRSSRAHTPDTIRELELEGSENHGGRTTPQAERASFVPTLTGPIENTIHQQSTLEKEFEEQLQLDEQLRQQRLADAGLTSGAVPAYSPTTREVPPEKFSEKMRRISISSSASSESLSSIDTLSSSDDIALGDVPAIRRTLAEEFRRDPKNTTHLKNALAQIRQDVKAQQISMASTSNKLQRKSLHAASKEHRKAMRAEMKELRREIKSYHKIVQIQKKDDREARREQRKLMKQDLKSSRKEARGLRKSERKSRKHGGRRGCAAHDALIPRSGAADASNPDWRNAVPGHSSSWPFGQKPSGLPEEDLPADMPPGWPFGGELPGWPWNEKLGTPKQKYPSNWPLGNMPQNWPLGQRPPGWPLTKTPSAPVTRKPVPPRRPEGSSPTPSDTGSPGSSNIPAPPSPNSIPSALSVTSLPPAYGISPPPMPHGVSAPPTPYGFSVPPVTYGTHLSPTASNPAAHAARAASRSPSPGPATPANGALGPRFVGWGGRGRGGRPGADWTGGRGRRHGDEPHGFGGGFGGGYGGGLGGRGRGYGRDRSGSDAGVGSSRGFGRGRHASDDAAGLIGMARDYIVQQAAESIERLRPVASSGAAGPAARASPSHTYGAGPGDGQETGVAHKDS